MIGVIGVIMWIWVIWDMWIMGYGIWDILYGIWDRWDMLDMWDKVDLWTGGHVYMWTGGICGHGDMVIKANRGGHGGYGMCCVCDMEIGGCWDIGIWWTWGIWVGDMWIW